MCAASVVTARLPSALAVGIHNFLMPSYVNPSFAVVFNQSIFARVRGATQ